MHTVFWVQHLKGRNYFEAKRRWEDDNSMDLGTTAWECVDWMHLFHDRNQWRAVVIMVMELRLP